MQEKFTRRKIDFEARNRAFYINIEENRYNDRLNENLRQIR